MTMTATAPVPILVVDDNPNKRLALKAILSPLGHSIVEADSGVAALRCVMAEEFAVILLDVRMPLMDGFETAARIRQRRQSEMTPIIFITAHANDEIVDADRYAEGAVDFIHAPVAPDELRSKVSVFANLFSRARVLAERAQDVQRSADQLRILTDAAPVGIFQTDAENRYVYTNPRWTEITGVAPEAAAGRAWDTIIASEQRASLVAEFPDGAMDQAELAHRFEIQAPDSHTRIVLVTSKAMRDSDGVVAGWVGTLADITAEAGAEAAMSGARDQATEASRLKSDFLANMSHEIRTPMNGVIGMTDLLLETDLDARQRDYAQTVRNSGEALLIIIDDILDFSKVEAGKLQIEDIEFSPRAIIDDLVDLLAGAAQSKGLELVAVIEGAVPAVVSGDPGRVRQVLTNLIGNAIKFTESGEVVLRATVVAGDGRGTVLHFEVSDTGVGIATDKLAPVFQPFVQADTSTSRRYGGTGLGLAISGQLVALMGGSCGVSSELGVGSRFWFTICVRAEAAPASEGRSAPDPDLAGIRALIVDDNATQRSVLGGYLTGWGMNVTTAGTGEAALAAMRTETIHGAPFAVVVIDRAMPGMDGIELSNTIVADPELDARMVLMTGLGRERQHVDPGSGISAAVSKPVHREDLRTCLLVALGARAEDQATTDSTIGQPPSSGQPEIGRLLLAEDNLVNQRVAVAILSSAGYRVDTVLNGAEAVEAVAAHPYDAVLMDCQMPELNGYEATVAIRASEGSGRHTPIIALTAGARREDRERCLAEGMDGYLAKPIRKDSLLAMVGRWVTSHPGHSATMPSNGLVATEKAIDPSVVDAHRVLAGAAEPAMLAGSARPVLDATIVSRLHRLGSSAGENLVEQLADLFLADASSHVATLRQALAASDSASLFRAAHTLAGASANLGATDLARLCDTLAAQSNGDAPDAAGAGGLLTVIDAVETELGRVIAAVGALTSTP